MKTINSLLILAALLLLSSACVSRTVISSDDLTGSGKQIIEDKKLVWFWQEDF